MAFVRCVMTAWLIWMVTETTYWNSCSILHLGEGESPEPNIACVEKAGRFRTHVNRSLLLLVLMVKATLLELQFFDPSHVGVSLAGYRAYLHDVPYGKAMVHSSQKNRVAISHVKRMSEVPKSTADQASRNVGWPKGLGPLSGPRPLKVARAPRGPGVYPRAPFRMAQGPLKMDLEKTTYGHRAIIVANAPLNSGNNVKDGSQLGYMVRKDVTRRWAGIHASVQVRTFSSKAFALGTGPRAKGPRAPFLEGNWTERATIPTEFIAFQSKCVRWKGPIKENVYKFLLDPCMFEIAYTKLRSNPGNLTPGINPTPLDGINAEWIQEIIASLKDESFQFTPGRRINTAKPQGGTKAIFDGLRATLGGPRPLTITPPRDKIVMEMMRMILEAIYEPTFSPYSHGFRAAHSCHTAFRQIREKFEVASWYMVGDIAKCYDTIDHHKLMALIESKILDRKFSRLVWKSLRAGYFEFDNSQQSLIGTPQGSVISPILANIFMDQLDKFIEASFMNLFMKGLMEGFDQGTCTCNFKPYHRLNWRLNHSIGNLPKEETRKIAIQMRRLSSRDPMDPNLRRLVYVRYADNWIIGIRGSHAAAVDIKTKVEEFLKEKMGLTLNAEKTLITHAETEKALFLGTYIFKARARTTRTSSKGHIIRNAKEIRLEAPIKHIVSKLTKANFVRKGRSWPKFIWIHCSLDQIITLYNAVIRGYMNYYSFVDNRAALATYVYYLLRGSCAKLIAAKMKLGSQLKVFEKYGKSLTVNVEKNLFLHKPGYKRRPGRSKSAMLILLSTSRAALGSRLWRREPP